MNIFLVEDDKRLGKLIKYMLDDEGYEVNWSLDGALNLSWLKCHDLVILDWMLPGVSGIELCRLIRANQNFVPILMLTARDKVSDKVAGLEAGADDYVVKPFEFSELLARIRSLLRRTRAFISEEFLHFNGMILNRSSKTVVQNQDVIQLSNREFQLLELLASNKGVISRETIIDRIWGLESDVSENNLDAYIRLLRKKIDLDGQPSLISNVRGIGYKLG
ncbi:MAG TPA: response regulator transcription factor [Negativicutes bacterium]|jgi:DNA-binding response OmpR family regulator